MRRAVLGCISVIAALGLSLPMMPAANAAISYASAQYRLGKLGCSPGAVTGTPNERTKWALVRFQAANALYQTGKLSDSTRAKLADPDRIACNKRPIPTNTGTGRRMVMSQKQNWIWLIRADGSVAWQAGIIDNPSAVKMGIHYTGSKCGRAAKIRKNYSYNYKYTLDYFTRFVACGIGFHRVPTYPGTDTQIHPDYYLGTDAFTSGGCVRTSLETARKIWYFTSSTTKVVVISSR